MNIVTAYPTHLPTSPVNPFTEQARRENMQKELIEPSTKNAPTGHEKAVGSDAERARNAAQGQQSYDFSQVDINGNETAIAITGKKENPDESAQHGEQHQQKQQEQAAEAAEQEKTLELKRRDAEVRSHEQAHAAVGGQYAGAPQYEFETGPDGKRYAVSGEVSISTSPISGDAQATIEKMETVRAAALAPAQPSAQDLKVAAEATQTQNAARAELASEQVELSSAQGKPFVAAAEQDAEIRDRKTIIQGFYAAAVQPYGERSRGVYA